MSFNIPNLLTLLRMGMIPLFVIALLNQEPGKALAIFAIAGLTDLLDGFLARVFDQGSVLGAYLDPIADKLLLTTAYIMLTIPSENSNLVPIPIWVTVIVLSRDFLILVIALVLWMALDLSKFTPTKLSKVNTVVQVAGVLLVLLSGIFDQMAIPAVICIYLVGGLTVLSGCDYIYRANQMITQAGGHAET